MASPQMVFLILASAYMTVQAQGNQSACNQSTKNSASVESATMVKEIVSEAVDELTSAVRELKAELKDLSMAVSQLKEMLNTQRVISKKQAADIKALREGLSYQLENSERKIEWAITDGSLAPRNTSWVMESFKRIEQRLDDIESHLNSSQVDLGKTKLKYHDCAEIYHAGKRTSGVNTIYPQGSAHVNAYCDMETDGGGWTVFQKRCNGAVDFFRGWEEYALGFGNPEGEYWLGLRHIHALTKSQPTVLYVEVTDFDLGAKYAKYGTFKVSSEAEEFRLNVGSYTGNAGDSLMHIGYGTHNGQKFSTKDRDNDLKSGDCSNQYHGAWWYKHCHYANLNGHFSSTKVSGSSYMNWYYLRNSRDALKASVMMLRPAKFKP